MIELLKAAKHKINSLIWHFTSTGIILLMLGVLIVWTDFMLRLVIGMLVIVIAYAFLVLAYKFWCIKKEIEKHLGL